MTEKPLGKIKMSHPYTHANGAMALLETPFPRASLQFVNQETALERITLWAEGPGRGRIARIVTGEVPSEPDAVRYYMSDGSLINVDKWGKVEVEGKRSEDDGVPLPKAVLDARK